VEIVLFACVISVFYLMILGPARNRKQRELDIKEHLKPGVEVMTTSGMFARVHSVTEDELHLELAPGVIVRCSHLALRNILTPELEARDAKRRGRRKASTTKPNTPGEGPGNAQDGEPPASNGL
jgi:preprotein translocase subunit YajC